MVAKKTEEKTQSFYFVPAPFVPAWEWFNDDARGKEWESFKSNAKKIGEQLRDMQMSSIDATRKQWDIFFDGTSKMQESFIDSLPDEAPAFPGFPPFLPLPTKAALKKGKEARDERNRQNKEQFDSFVDDAKKRQAKVKERISENLKDIEEKAKKKE